MKAIPIAAMALLAAACSAPDGGDSAVPRIHAYPRLQLPDTAMTPAEGTPLRFYINAAATASRPRPDWLDVAYPALGITLHISFTRSTSAEIPAVMENRMERLMLNAGNAELRMEEFTNSAGFDIAMAETPGATTPLQFLATDHSEWVVSGAAYLADPMSAAAVDSLRPAIEAVRRDVARSLSTLSPLP